MFFLILVVGLLTALVLFCYKTASRFRDRGVKADSMLTGIYIMFKNVMGWEHVSVNIYKKYFKFEDQRFIGAYVFGSPMVQVQDIELIKKIIVKDFEHFLDHRNMAAGDPLFARNLFTLKGDEWKDMRSKLSPAFTSSKIRLMVPFMVDVGDQMVLSLKNNIKESGSKYLEVNGKDLTARYANDVIASCAFGLKVDSHSDRENEFFLRGRETTTFKLGQIFLFFMSATYPKLMEALKIKLFSEKTHSFFTNLVLSTMDNREKNNIIRPDMIHILMEAKKGKLIYEEQSHDNDAGFATVEESAVGKKKITREWEEIDLVAQAVIFFIAGFETVSATMSFLLYELAVNPDVQDRLVQEIKETNVKNGGFDYNAIQNMTYMDMVVSEVLRKWPSVFFLDRLCTKDYNMGKPNEKATKDYIVCKGEGVQIPVWAIHRDHKYYPDPEKFDPERFSVENKHNINPFAYLPFGLGPRNCIGSRFALCEVKVMAYQLFQHMEVSPSPRTTITTELDPRNFNTWIKGGHWVRFNARIRKGEGLSIQVFSLHRDPKHFPDPEKFDPERFSEENKHNIKPFAYSPFGLSPRNCIGSRFALCEVKVMAYQLLQHMEVTPGPRTAITNKLDTKKFTLQIKGGHWVRFNVRV